MNELFYPRILLVTPHVLSLAQENLVACIKLLDAFIANGLDHIVLCPGSRSTPLALAAGGFAELGRIKLITSIDERSAAFLALGISTAKGKGVVVITTSGTAVANLLPAAIEADRSCQSLIFLTADRPERLKNCGSNQTVNQEEFLASVCRIVEQSPKEGLHNCTHKTIENLGNKLWNHAHSFPGPVHCNIAIEEPLHPSYLEQRFVWNIKDCKDLNQRNNIPQLIDYSNLEIKQNSRLDPFGKGVIIAGPWRGLSGDLDLFNEALKKWQNISGWPIFADPLSGIDSEQIGLIYHWELLLEVDFLYPNNELNILRLGPLPASRSLENWLIKLKGKQLLISEGDKRYLDPLKLADQWSYGLAAWLTIFYNQNEFCLKDRNRTSTNFLKKLIEADSLADSWLNEKIKLNGFVTEPSLARHLPKLLPANFQFMLSASSPVRDWIVFGGSSSISKRCFSFRGASGIDGTLSLSMGLASVLGPLLLVTGDLALLHDSNGWLFAQSLKAPLIVLLIDNGGGGIFKQLEIDICCKGDFEELFQMPQKIDHLALASAHYVEVRQISILEDLEPAIEWAVCLRKPVLLRVCTNPKQDKKLRNHLREALKEHLGTIIKSKEIEF